MANLAQKALNIEDLRRKMAKRRLTKALFDFCDKGSEDQVAMRDNRLALWTGSSCCPRVLRRHLRRAMPASRCLGKEHGSAPADRADGSGGLCLVSRGDRTRAGSGEGEYPVHAGQHVEHGTWRKSTRMAAAPSGSSSMSGATPEAAFVTIQRALDAGFEGAGRHRGFSRSTTTARSMCATGWSSRRAITLRTADRQPEASALAGRHGGTLLSCNEGKLPAFTNIHVPEEAKAEATGYVSAKSTSFLNRNETLTWDFLKRVRDAWPHKLLVKGVLHPDDAVTAADCGADGIFVSNHAGNVNDTAVTPWDALPAIRQAVGDRLTIIADSGVRRGSDVLKGLALGADVIAIGRATLYGVGAAGEAGATRALEILESEITRTMAVLGVTDIPSIGREHILLPNELPVSGTGTG